MNNRKFNFRIAIAACVALLLSVAVITGVMLNREKPNYQYGDTIAEYENEGFNINVKYVEPLETPNVLDSTMVVNKDWSIADYCDLVVKAKVVDSKEIDIECIAIEDKDLILHAYGEILTLEITDDYYRSDLASDAPKTITAFSIVSSRNLLEDGIIAQPGEEYYFFLESSKDIDTPVCYDRLCEYMITVAPITGYFITSSETITPQLEKMLDYNFKMSGLDNKFKVGDDLGEALKYLFK